MGKMITELMALDSIILSARQRWDITKYNKEDKQKLRMPSILKCSAADI